MIFDQQYMQLCSEKTLLVDKEGFFLPFAQKVTENVGENWIKNVFGKLKTDKERIRRIYEDDKIKQNVVDFLANVQEVYRQKSPQIAKTRLSEAETALKIGDKKKALNLYNQSVLKAAKTEQSFALLRRAKTLISLNEFSSALTDIQVCLKEKIPNNLKFEAFWMMAVCFKALKDETKAKVSLGVAEKLIGDNKKLLGMVRHSMQIRYEPIKRSSPKIPKISERHDKLTNASAKITVRDSQEMGRYIVANREIQTGEILVVEDASVACLLPEKFGTHCHHCFDRFLAPLGCPDCASVAFCSPTCRDAAISSYHKYECKFLDLLIGSGMSVLSFAALRSVTQQNPKDDYYGLCTNSWKRPSGDFLQRTLMAAFLLRCLQKSGYFPGSDSVVPTEEEYRIGEMLLRYLQVLQFNAHEIFETLYTAEHRLKGGKPAYIGVAVYPTVALFNHECYPAVTRYFVGKHIVITSLRPLTPGAPISENYGPIFTHHQLMHRQRSLSSRYWFNCQCSACLEDWSLNHIKHVRCPTINCSRLFSLPVTQENLQCPKCNKNVCLSENIEKLKWCEEQYEVASQLIENKDTERATKVLCEALDVFHRVAAPPHRETHTAEEALRICLVDGGNTYDCLVKKETH